MFLNYYLLCTTSRFSLCFFPGFRNVLGPLDEVRSLSRGAHYSLCVAWITDLFTGLIEFIKGCSVHIPGSRNLCFLHKGFPKPLPVHSYPGSSCIWNYKITILLEFEEGI
ncbi:109aa long hypothetical protein [Pyrococcus horikoshii OT3]|uniref:Uncharacterized protein n=1 Tax=Pyrococcus horikoshii (strain ATCC 700860 / DSM 12428 / JCM 9974 / NBRC 100139 / OT-3) TaxID=70601 RepID=O58057_PYRHO|nr:109aa long hypothetical protein [Pyrococcus horikoshii OT3]